jgi:hypothetical protein
MERRGFIQLSIAGLLACAVSLTAGCGKPDSASKLSNQEKLWSAAVSSAELKEPVDLAYAKNTPALFKDASYGKEDPNFKPKTGGG